MKGTCQHGNSCIQTECIGNSISTDEGSYIGIGCMCDILTFSWSVTEKNRNKNNINKIKNRKGPDGHDITGLQDTSDLTITEDWGEWVNNGCNDWGEYNILKFDSPVKFL